MMKYIVLGCMVFSISFAEPPVHVKPTNLLGTSDQHASFSFIRPGLTQTAFAFSGPSSHQSFSSSIGNPYLAQKVLPNVANALAYRNPGLGVFPVGPITNGYAAAQVTPTFVPSAPAPLPYQAAAATDPAALAYYQQLQQVQQPQLQGYSAAALYQAQLAQLLALRQAQAQSQGQQVQVSQAQQVPEQIELQQEEQQQQQQQQRQQHQQQQQLQQQEQQSQNLLGIAYSSAPSVARVKVSGNGYKFDF